MQAGLCHNPFVEPLVSSTETRLADGGLLAILVALALRWAVFMAWKHNSALLDSQLIAAGVLIAALNLTGLFLPRALAAVPMLLGALGWAFALSLAPPYFWPTGERPQWIVWGALGLGALSFAARWWMLRRWSATIYGKGWAWIDNWARDRSLRARVLARKALITLGYRRAREAADGAE
jgi:hypothetical protein